ncbi:MAG TPA: AgmX/PglI C-terminal domain-containing protein [Byssovorax sp.]|jgi:hypothetical protein
MKTPYRSDQEALEQRLAALQHELTTALLEMQAHDGAAARKERLEKEILEVAERLSRAQGSRLLESIRIASPCNAAWGDMQGDEHKRLCGSCEKNVYDLSKMTRSEAEELITANETACVRLFRRRDGTVVTADCPVGRRRRRLRNIAAASVGSAVVVGAMLLRWRTASSEIQVMAGGIGPEPTSVPEPTATVDVAPSVEAVQPAPTYTGGLQSISGPGPTPKKIAGAPFGNASTGTVEMVEGTVTNAPVVVSGMGAGLRRCYNKGLSTEDPGMRGSVRVTASVGPNGEVVSVTATDSPGLSPAVLSCVKARVASAQFSEPPSGHATLKFVVTLLPR